RYSPPWKNALTPGGSSLLWARTSSDCLEGYGPAFECWAANSRPAQLTANHSDGSPLAGGAHHCPRPRAHSEKSSPETAIFLGDKKETNRILSARNLFRKPLLYPAELRDHVMFSTS